MNKYIPFIILLFLSCLMEGCRLNSNSGELPVIDVAGNLGTYRQVKMSEFISDVEYIPLETGPNCLIDRTNHIVVTDTKIFIGGYNQCYVFTREGKFISDVGRVGRGPGEWRYFSGMSVDENNQVIYLDTYEKVFEYTWDGRFVRDFEKPIFNEGKAYVGRASYVTFLRDNLFLGHISNHSGHEANNWIILDDTGTIVKAFDNHIMLEKDESVSFVLTAPRPFVASEEAYVKEFLNDTLFNLNRNNELVPKFVFDLGKYAFPHDDYIPGNDVQNRSNKSMVINSDSRGPMIVTAKDIFFPVLVGSDICSDFKVPEGVSRPIVVQGREYNNDDTRSVLGLYDIKKGKTEFLGRDPVSRMLGLVNDIDGGLSFWPRYCNSANELIDVWQAFDMKDLLDEEYFSAHPAKDPEAHEKLRSLLKNLDENDNPIIVVAKLKK